MRRIKLTTRKYALVDNEDYKRLKDYVWMESTQGYVYRTQWSHNKPTSFLMQRVVTKASNTELIKFRDGNKLNNQKYNLNITGKNILRTCPVCSKEYYTWPCRIRKGIKTCSRKCGYQIRRERFGADNNAWKGGITPKNVAIRGSARMEHWRKDIFERDDYTCQHCGARNGNGKKIILHADHIKPFAYFPELRFELSNGRTLCKPCHEKTDTYAYKALKFAIAK